MKNPESMTRRELVEYANHLKSMIAQLQSEIRKMTETIDEHLKKGKTP